MRDCDQEMCPMWGGDTCCAHHAMTAHGLRHAHGSDEGHARRVAQIAASCPDCLRHQEGA